LDHVEARRCRSMYGQMRDLDRRGSRVGQRHADEKRTEAGEKGD
jgi:hypothetical protein